MAGGVFCAYACGCGCMCLGHFHVVGGEDAGSGADYASPENTV
jgi:hypothetical protein